MMKKKWLCAALAGVMLLGSANVSFAQGEEKTILFVSTDGNDANSGTIDSPFKTPEAARDKIRELKKEGNLGKDGAVVYFREGNYNQLNIFELNEQDSGTPDAPICYRAYRDEDVKFIGGMYLDANDFVSASDEAKERIINQNAKNRVVQYDLRKAGMETVGDTEWLGSMTRYPSSRFLTTGVFGDTVSGPELFVDDVAMQVARYPNDGYIYTKEVIAAGSRQDDWWWTDPETGKQTGDKSKAIPFTVKLDTDRMKYWKNAKNALIYGRFVYEWADQTVGLASVDENEQTITSAQPSMYGIQENKPLYIYNLIEEIDSPGEYFIDKENLMLYLYPPQDGLGEILLTNNDIDILQMNNTHDITVKNIDFKGGRGRAVSVNNSENCLLDGCDISFFMLWNVLISGGKNNGLKNCIIHDNNGGVDLYGGNRDTLEESGHYVENCEFYRNDRKTKTYCPSLKMRGVGQRASYNKFHQSEHDMIEYQGNNHIIEFNEFFDCCTNADDMGAIYNCRDLTYQGVQIRYNYFHNVGTEQKSGKVGTQAIFLDDFSSAATISGNVFEKINGSPIKLAGSDNKILNNIFVNNTGENCKMSVEATRSFAYGGSGNTEQVLLDTLAKVPYMSEAWQKQYPWMAEYIKPDGNPKVCEDIVVAHNLLYNSPDVSFSAEIGKYAHVEDNYTSPSDPGFYDYKKRNYLLKEDAQVYKIMQDFKPIPFTRMGMYSKRATDRIKDGMAFADDSPYAYVLGEKKTFAQDYSIRSFKENDVLYVPLRFVCEGFGAKVDYDDMTGKISISNDLGVSVISADLKQITDEYGDAAAPKYEMKKQNGRVYVAVDDAAKLFSMQVYNADVTVISPTKDIFVESDKEIVSYLRGQLSEY